MRTASKTAKAKLQMINTKKEVSMLRPTRIRRSGRAAYPQGANLKWKKTGKDRNNPPNATRENEHHKKEKSKHLHPHPSASIGRLLQTGLDLLLILVI